LQNGKYLVENNNIGSTKGLFRSDGIYQINISLRLGALADFNMWNHTLGYKEMAEWTTCK
jgi:hypothetical protein